MTEEEIQITDKMITMCKIRATTAASVLLSGNSHPEAFVALGMLAGVIIQTFDRAEGVTIDDLLDDLRASAKDFIDDVINSPAQPQH